MTYFSVAQAAKSAALGLLAIALVGCGNADKADKDADPDMNADVSSSETSVAANTLPKAGFDAADIAKMSPAELMEATTSESNRLADVLASVEDEASAEAAVAQIRALGPEIKALGERLDSLDEADMKLSIKTMKRLQSLAEAQMRIFNETGRIATDHPELRDIMTEAFEDIEIDLQ